MRALSDVIYNTDVKKHFGLQNILILLLILTLILAPRPLSGLMLLQSAYRFDAAGNQDRAAAAYAFAAARLPWTPSLWEQAGKAAFLAGDLDNSILYLDQAAADDAISKSGWLDLGLAYQQRGDSSNAVQAWEQAIPLPDAYRQLAQTQQQAGNFAAAIEDWQASLSGDTQNANAHYQLGLLLAATDPGMALPELIQAVQLDSALEEPVQELRTALNTALLSDQHAYQLLVSGQALASLGKWDLAGEAFRNAVQLDSNYAEAWAWLGQAKQQLGQSGGQEFAKALALGPELPIVQGLYGLYLQREGNPEGALAAYKKAAEMEPGNPGWQIALGSAFEQNGDLVSAYMHYTQAVELAPQNSSAWQAIAAFSVNNDVDVAETGLPAALKLIELSPDSWLPYDLAGQAASLLEDTSGAEGYLKKAAELAPTQAAPALHLALVYLQMGDPSRASSYLTLAKTLDPTGPYGWQAGRLLEQMVP
jgi:tetratricopeptide (TPR) repeat protein